MKKHPEHELLLRQIASRLKEERMSCGLTPEAAADAGFVSRSTQFMYENATRLPDAMYLFWLDAQGVDTLYVTTGRRERKVASLSKIERVLLEDFGRLSEDDRSTVLGVLQLACRPPR